MEDKDLEQIMKEEWQKVRKVFYYPQLPQPKLSDNELDASIDQKSLAVTIGKYFVEELESKGITPEESLNEILTHELTHYMKFPGSFLNILKLQKSVQGITDSQKISGLRDAFNEAQTNIYQLKELESKTTAKVKRAYGLSKDDHLRRLMYELYQEVSGQDFGIELKEKSLVGKLKNIDYTDKEQEINNFRKFVQILKDYEPPQSQEKQGNSNSRDNLGGFSENQIKEGLKKFAEECSDPEEYEEIVKQVLDENKDSSQANKKSAGLGKGVTELADNFYTALAEKYAIPITKKSMHKNGALYPYSHTLFEIGDSIFEVDAFSTPGILPGITTKWVKKEGEGHEDSEAIPHSLLVIDNSPSMFASTEFQVINPSKAIYQHIVGATAISNAYLLNGSKVAIYSFGSDDHLTSPTKDKEVVHRELRRYSSSGGTKFNSNFLERLLKDSEGEYDISIVSDMCIKNLEGFIDTVLKIPQTHRIHLLYTENNNYVGRLRDSFGKRNNVAILPLTCKRDIPQIIMGELQKSIN